MLEALNNIQVEYSKPSIPIWPRIPQNHTYPIAIHLMQSIILLFHIHLLYNDLNEPTCINYSMFNTNKSTVCNTVCSVLFHIPNLPYKLLIHVIHTRFYFVLYDLYDFYGFYGFEKCQIFTNGMMLKMENQKTTRFVPGQNISGLKIKSWNKHVQINHNLGHISITWPLEMLNAHAIKWTYLEYGCKMLRANEWLLLDIGCFKMRGMRKKFEKVLKRWIMRPFDICDNYMF